MKIKIVKNVVQWTSLLILLIVTAWFAFMMLKFLIFMINCADFVMIPKRPDNS